MQRTRAASTEAWLVELALRAPEEAIAWREGAGRACSRAVGAYQEARGCGESVVPEEEDR